MPPSWDRASDRTALRSAKLVMWRDVVAPSCMPCHRTLESYDWAEYDVFERFGKQVNGGASFLETLLAPDARTPMPQAELTAKRLSVSGSASHALATWISAANALEERR